MTEKFKKITLTVCFQVLLPIIILGALIAFDQISKQYIDKNYVLNGSRIDFIDGFFGFAYVRNTGASFSLLSNAAWGQIFFKIITPIALAGYLLLYVFGAKKSFILKYALILTAAGTIGNYIDRLAFGYVIDFLSFTFFGYDFAIFNLADVFLCVGVFALIVYYFFLDEDAVFKFKKSDDDTLKTEETEVVDNGQV